MGVNLPWCQPVLTLVKCVPTVSQWTFTFSFMTCCKSCTESQWMELACVLCPQARTSALEPQGCCLLIHISLCASPTLNKHYQRILTHFWKPDSQPEESAEPLPSAYSSLLSSPSSLSPAPLKRKWTAKREKPSVSLPLLCLLCHACRGGSWYFYKNGKCDWE